MKKGFFITFEGCDGCGKTTQSVIIVKKLKELGCDVVHSREPGGTVVAEAVRNILLNPKNKIFPVTELLLYEACRSQHTNELIIPSLYSDKIVVCERYTDATVAYQGFGRGLDRKTILALNRIATSGIVPDITILFDSDLKKGLRRVDLRGKDRLENENIAFHRRVRAGYMWLAKKYPRRIKIVKTGSRSIEDIACEIYKIIVGRLKVSRKLGAQ